MNDLIRTMNENGGATFTSPDGEIMRMSTPSKKGLVSIAMDEETNSLIRESENGDLYLIVEKKVRTLRKGLKKSTIKSYIFGDREDMAFYISEIKAGRVFVFEEEKLESELSDSEKRQISGSFTARNGDEVLKETNFLKRQGDVAFTQNGERIFKFGDITDLESDAMDLSIQHDNHAEILASKKSFAAEMQLIRDTKANLPS